MSPKTYLELHGNTTGTSPRFAKPRCFGYHGWSASALWGCRIE